MKAVSSPQLQVLGAEPGGLGHSRPQRVQLTSFKTSFCPRLHSTSFTVSKCRHLSCTRAAIISIVPKEAGMASLKFAGAALARTFTTVEAYPRHVQCAAAAGLMAFALWGLGPLVQFIRRNVFQRREWDKSRTKRIFTSYLRPLMLWAAAIVLCRALDPVVLASERSQAIKERFLNFLRSLSTVLAFAFCTARLTQQIQKVMIERQTNEDARNLGIRFIGNAVSTSVWVAAVCLFMELLGFSTQKWLTAGGFGTVLLTLAGREIFTNFLSSVMIHATRPFVECEWIQTKIDGQEVSGTVEHVGWWSPTVIRGEDREAVHIPNHKFTMSVVRNLSQKTHWRIKTHIGISHLDANKINLIVADMRKVLAKQPQVEHRRLHRRVFLDNIDPVNQSLLVMVSCFVKTSHFEEYLSVKEIILLNLLKVISHHNARLATPIRSIQRIYDEVETRQSPFRNVRSEDSIGRPLLLVEASAAGEPTEVHRNGSTKNGSSSIQPDSATSSLRNATSVEGVPSHSTTKKPSEPDQVLSPEVIPATKSVLEGLESMGLNSNDISLLGAAFEKPPGKISERPIDPGLPVDPERISSEDEFNEQQSTAKKSEIPSQKVVEKAHQTDIGKLKPQKDQSLQETKDGKLKPQKDAQSLQETKDGKLKPPKDTHPLQEMNDGKLKPPKDARPLQELKNGKLKPPKDAHPLQETEDSQGDPWRQATAVTSTPQRRENVKTFVQDEKPAISTTQNLEDNLVLGLALAGSKRTLPLDDEIMNHLDKEPGTKRNAAATQRISSGKDTIDRQA